MPDQEMIKPIEEASTEEVIAPTCASDRLNWFYSCDQLGVEITISVHPVPQAVD